MLVKLKRYLKGYLKISVTGNCTERFLTLCKNKNLNIWNLKYDESTYEMNMSCHDFLQLKSLIRKTKTHVKILSKYGFPFFQKHWMKRKMFLLGAVFFFVFLWSMSTRLWTIQIQGNQELTYDVIVDYLKTEEIYLGMRKAKIHYQDLTASFRKNFEEITWVSVSIDGTKLCVDLKENTDSFIQNKSEEPAADLVSNQAGVITKIITREGIPMVKTGDYVDKGDLLVSGMIPIVNDNKEVTAYEFAVSDADVWIERIVPYNAEISRTYTAKKYSTKNRYGVHIQIGNVCIQIPKRISGENMQERSSLELIPRMDKLKIPVSINLIIKKPYEFVHKLYTEEERETLLNARYNLYCSQLAREEISVFWEEISLIHKEEQSIMEGKIGIYEKIGYKRKIIGLNEESMLQ